MSAETGKRSHFNSVGSSHLANTGLVALTINTSCGSIIDDPIRQGPSQPTKLRGSTSSKEPNETDGMSIVRQCYEARGVSRSTVGLLTSSWRGGTKKQYSGYTKKWTKFVLKGKSIIFNQL